MREIDLESWPRRHHYRFFRKFQRPHFDVATRVDVTEVVGFCRTSGHSLFGTLMHLALKTANEVPAFRLRFRGERVFDVEECHGSFTFLDEGELFNYATVSYRRELEEFLPGIKEAVAAQRGREDVNLDDGDRLSLIYITSLPWIDILSVSHPFMGGGDDCVPRIAWGRVVKAAASSEGEERHEMTLQVTAHHALLDGVHVAKFLGRFGENVAALAKE